MTRLVDSRWVVKPPRCGARLLNGARGDSRGVQVLRHPPFDPADDTRGELGIEVSHAPRLRGPEISWLARRDKQLVAPVVLFGSSPDCSGCYFSPSDAETEIGDYVLPPHGGAIFVDTETCGADVEDPVGSVLAHEWRHHWQAYNDSPYDGEAWDGLYARHAGDYWQALRDYYRNSRSEADALRYEARVAPSEFNLFVAGPLVGIIPPRRRTPLWPGPRT